jgi:glycosyltransferase involved in cell wall biosynthesis
VPNFATHYLHTFNEADSLLQNVVWTYSVRLHNRYDQVVFPTEVHRHLFVQQGLSSPAAVISNGVDTKRYRPAGNRPAEIERRYNLPSGPRILFVSRLARDKRIDVLIEAMPHVLMDRPAHLLLVGRGDDTQRLQELVASLELEDHVHFLGFVPEADLPGVYQASDLFAMASTVEVQSIPMLQALASGLPAVAVDAMALPELVHDDTNGYLVTPGSARGMARAILRILRNPERAARMGHKGLEIVRPHAEERTYTSYEQLYTGVIAGRNGKAGPAT